MTNKTREDFSGNFTLRPGFQHQDTTTQGTRCKAILKLAPPMYLTWQDPISATWFQAAILVIQNMSMSPSGIEVSIESTVNWRQSKEETAPRKMTHSNCGHKNDRVLPI